MLNRFKFGKLHNSCIPVEHYYLNYVRQLCGHLYKFEILLKQNAFRHNEENHGSRSTL